jgi:predicted nucleic-acid-binding Zn-ribbon protein
MTLRRDHVCPNCDGRKIWTVRRAPAPGQLGYTALPVAEIDGEGTGRFETLVCGGCGYTEWYAMDIDAFARFAGEGSKYDPVALVADPAKGDAPYR